jgi:hypothetical protein
VRNERPVFNLLDPEDARRLINRHTRLVVNHIRDIASGRFLERRAKKIISIFSGPVMSLEWWFVPCQGVAQVILEDLHSGECSFDGRKGRLSSFIELAMFGDSQDILRKDATARKHRESFWHHQRTIHQKTNDSNDMERFLAGLPDHLLNGLQQPLVQARMRFRGISSVTAATILRSELAGISQQITANQLGMHNSTFSKAKHFLYRLLAEYPAWVPEDVAHVLGLAN